MTENRDNNPVDESDPEVILFNTCRRLRMLIRTQAPDMLIKSNCKLLVINMCRKFGPTVLRRWFDEFTDRVVNEISNPTPQEDGSQGS